MRRAILAVLVACLLVGGGSAAYVQAQLNQPIPPLTATSTFPSSITVEGQPPSIPWPQAGAAAVAVPSLGVVATFGDKRAQPIASIGKVMTAHVILSNHPLALRDQGPTVSVTPEDVRTYQTDAADGQSTVPVVAGSSSPSIRCSKLCSCRQGITSRTCWLDGTPDRSTLSSQK